MTYVMFVVVWFSKYIGSNAGTGGMASFQYEFKDKAQCENAVKVMEKRFLRMDVKGYCQEVRK